MNDPGLDSPISDEARAMENEKQSDERDEVEEDEHAFLVPTCVLSLGSMPSKSFISSLPCLLTTLSFCLTF